MMKMRQLEESEVVPAICEGITVIRVNLNTNVACDLCKRSVNGIRKEFGNADFIYFTVKEV